MSLTVCAVPSMCANEYADEADRTRVAVSLLRYGVAMPTGEVRLCSRELRI